MNLSAVFSDKLADEHSDIEDDGDFTNYWNRGVIGIATNGWRVLSKSADLIIIFFPDSDSLLIEYFITT